METSRSMKRRREKRGEGAVILQEQNCLQRKGKENRGVRKRERERKRQRNKKDRLSSVFHQGRNYTFTKVFS